MSLIFLRFLVVFPILLFSSISLHWSLRKAFLSLLAILWNSAFRCVYLSLSPLLFSSLLFTAICKASSDRHFAFLHFFFLGWSWFLSPVQCHEALFIVLRPSVYQLYSLESISHFHCIVTRDLILVIAEWSNGLPYFLQFKSEFGNKEFMIWATVNSQSCFCWLYRASPSLAAKNIISLFQYWPSVISMCRVFSCAVGRGCLLWPVWSLGKTLLAFALTSFCTPRSILPVTPGYLLTSYFCIPVTSDEKDLFFGC